MKSFLTAIFILFLFASVYSAPPEPPESSEEARVEENEAAEAIDTLDMPESVIETLRDLEQQEGIDRSTLRDLEKKILRLRNKYEGIGRVLQGIDEGYSIEELILGGDSVYIRLDNDSSFVFRYSEGSDGLSSSKNDIIHFGGTITIDEDEVIEGDVVSTFGDVKVYGTVEGGVIALSGDIYIASTGNVKGGVLALSGKVKQEPGSRVGSVTWGSRHVRSSLDDIEIYRFRAMGGVLFIIFVIWLILTATCASLIRSNVKTVSRRIIEDGVLKSFFMGYLSYFLALIIFIGLCITVLGLPLALLGMPLALLAAAVLSSTAISNLVGSRVLNTENYSFRTFFYGNLFMGLVPGLLFFVQLITGNLVIMIFSWIVIGIYIFIVLPVGLGAVLATRFGTRLRKEPVSQPTATLQS